MKFIHKKVDHLEEKSLYLFDKKVINPCKSSQSKEKLQ